MGGSGGPALAEVSMVIVFDGKGDGDGGGDDESGGGGGGGGVLGSLFFAFSAPSLVGAA